MISGKEMTVQEVLIQLSSIVLVPRAAYNLLIQEMKGAADLSLRRTNQGFSLTALNHSIEICEEDGGLYYQLISGASSDSAQIFDQTQARRLFSQVIRQLTVQ